MNIVVQTPQRGVLGEAQSPMIKYETTAFTREPLKRGMSRLAFDTKPTALLTLTVQEPRIRYRNDDGRWLVPDQTLMKKANNLLHFINSDLFGSKYRDKNKGFKGFGCIEKQANHQPHLHLAITNPMPPKLYLKAKKVLFKKLKKFSLFHESGTDFRLIGGDDADYWRLGNYLGKGGRLLTMGPTGVY